MKNGKVVILSAPSGAGKTTIVKHLLEQEDLNLEFSISACSRNKRQGEKHGVDYYFLPLADFREKIDEGAFVEWEEVYAGHYYGTLASELERIWGKGHHVLFEVDVKGGLNLKKIFGEKALSVFIMPPSIEELRRRLETRSTETTENINKRVEKAKEEMDSAGKFDKIIVNEVLETAKQDTAETIKKFLATS
jgi:guanylate kinase